MTDPLVLSPTAIERAVRTDPRLASEHSRRQYICILEDFERFRDFKPFTKTLVESYLAHLQNKGYAPSTVNQKLAIIRWWARKITDYAQDYGEPEQADEVSRAAARILTIKNVRGEEEHKGRHLSEEERDALLEACGSAAQGARNRAMIWLCWTNGVRVGTLASLRWEDVTRAHGVVYIKYTSKGGKHGQVILKRAALKAFHYWLKFRGTEPGPVFLPIKKTGQVVHRSHLPIEEQAISTEALRKILNGIIEESGVEDLTWHFFRHTLIGNVIEKFDIGVAQRIAGHSSVTTTAKYDWRPAQLQEAAIEELSE